MPASRTRILEFPVEPDQAFKAAQHAVSAVTKGAPSTSGTSVTGTKKTSWASWGENISLTVSEAAGGSRIVVKSASAMSTQFLDWGTHRKNLNALQHELEVATQAHAAVIEAG